MADATGRTDYIAQIDKACRLYADLGFSTLRMASQLIRSGYPPDLVRARFPEIPVSALPEPPRCRALDRARKSPRHALPSVSELLATSRVRAHNETGPVTAASAAQPPAEVSGAPAALTAGISFQYVPLIQC